MEFHLDVGFTKIPPKVGKQRPGAAQSISKRGTGSTPRSISILALNNLFDRKYKS